MVRQRVSQNKRKKVFADGDGRCAYCGRLLTYNEFQVDHKTPISPDNPDVAPGNNELPNLQVTCRPCNEDKGALTDDEYRAELRKRENEAELRKRTAGGHCFDCNVWHSPSRLELCEEKQRYRATGVLTPPNYKLNKTG